MFTEIRNAINAAECLESHLAWWGNNVKAEVERFESMTDKDDWDNARLAEECAKLDLYNYMIATMQKWVKNQL